MINQLFITDVSSSSGNIMRGMAARDSILVMVSLFSQWQHAFPMIPKNSTPRSTEYIKRIMRFHGQEIGMCDSLF